MSPAPVEKGEMNLLGWKYFRIIAIFGILANTL